MRIITTLNSTYEVDGDKIRRSEPASNPTSHSLADGEWKDLAAIEPHYLGNYLIHLANGRTVVTSVILGDLESETAV